MKTTYQPDLKAHVSLDEEKRVRHIRHSQQYWPSEENVPRLAAHDYLKQMADALQIPGEQLGNLQKKVSFLDPREQQGVEYQLSEEKKLFDASAVGYYQTYKNVPVWRRGLTVKIKQNPNRVVGSTKNSEDDIEGSLPDERVIERYRRLFKQVAARQLLAKHRLSEERQEGEDETATFVRNILKVAARRAPANTSKRRIQPDEAKLLRGRFFFYKYDPRKRFAGKPAPPAEKRAGAVAHEDQETPLLKLPPVSRKIKDGRAYLVAEILFKYDPPGMNHMVWLALVELETGSVLFIKSMTCAVNGMVFKLDPIVKSGDTSVTSDQPNSVLDDHDSSEELLDIDPPDGADTQHLSGTYIVIENVTDPNIAAPTKPTGDDFEFAPRTDNFAAVNAYYHQTDLFHTIDDLGFTVEDYFDGTTFPVPIDHRGTIFGESITINAHWVPNGSDGTDHMCFALCDLTDTDDPLGRAVDPYVHWHEMGGHGTLGDHVGDGSLGFAHSAGDGLAAVHIDPESQLRESGLPERFRYAPFRPFTTERRFDRAVADGWAWGGDEDINDNSQQYKREQILATCHFRIYRSLGGDADSLNRRKFASRVVKYLILRTIANLMPATNPNDAEVWCEEMQDTDLENWTSEGLSGGAYNKVIRWAFEKQGNYQPAGAPTPVTTEGDPPEVDVYIDDGRHGEYEYKHVHWQNISMWNRIDPDDSPGHQNAIEGETNYMYVKVKNRGTSEAQNVSVRAYHSLPGAGLTWPVDFTEMSPAGGLSAPDISPGNAEEVTIGPFEWVPNVNVHGHDCVLMIVSADGDPSNVDNFTGGETIQEWRLVPHDNNVGQRNVNLEPGAEGGEALMASLDGAVFFAGNNLNKTATMELKVEVPRVLAAKGWRLQLEGVKEKNHFRLKPGEKRKIQLKVSQGEDFKAEELRDENDRDFNVYLYADGMLLGGMTYRIDPNLKAPPRRKDRQGLRRADAARGLLDSLNLSPDRAVKKVSVKRVSVDIEMDDDNERE